MAKETAELSPSPSQMLRSIRPYLMPARADLSGEIRESETGDGQRFVAYLPPGHSDGGVDHPVLYHLHGASVRWPWVRKDITWIAAEHERAVASGVGEPMVIVGAYDPTRFSMWADSADGSNDRATAVLDGLIPHVESAFAVRAERSARFLQGFSMGGFGAATLGLKYQDAFGAIIVWDGALHDWNTLTSVRSKIAASQFGDDEAAFIEWSPWAMADRAELARTPILVVAGLMEEYARRYQRHLESLGANVTYASVACLHDMRCLARTYGRNAFAFLADT